MSWIGRLIEGGKRLVTDQAREEAAQEAAARLAEWLDGAGDPSRAISPEALAAAAAENRPILRDALAKATRQELASARSQGALIAWALPPESNGRILEILDWSHREHVQVLVQHHTWYDAQLNAARAWLLDGSSEGAAG